MFTFLSNFLQNQSIDTFGVLPLSACRVRLPHLLERAGIRDGSVLIMAVPYAAPEEGHGRNLSVYATARDYHLFFASLFEKLLSELNRRFPNERHAAFADHSPLDEVDAAARAGLGLLGAHRMLITPKYSSYVFLGEIITTASLPSTAGELRRCEDCGACRRACPMQKSGICLSALTQKKGDLTDAEAALLLQHPLVWGCDTCSEVCPHTHAARVAGTLYSPIPFFQEHRLPYLTSEALNRMTEEEFAARAYAWRGRKTLLRNLILKEKGDLPCSN